MTIINEEQGIDNVFEKRFEYFVKRFKIKRILHKIGATKFKGVLASIVFTFLMGLVFTRKNFFEICQSERDNLKFGKDVVYRFLDRSQVNWEKLVPELASSVIPEIDRLTSENRVSAWIIDDSPYYRNRSKKVELLSRCKDHSENRYYKGFTFLAMGWSDGCTFVPADFMVVSSGDDKNLLEGSNIKEDKRTLATKRRQQARTDKPTLVLDMLERAKQIHPETKHVLFDSWFSTPKALLDIKAKGYDVVARLKNHENYRYLYNGECCSIRQIYKKNKKRRGKSRYLLSVSVQIRHTDYDETVPATIVFIRNKNNRKEWFAIISTDTLLSEEDIITLYGKRWDIEPFFKVIKSALRLTKEFQLRSFDAIVAHAAIVLSRYIFMAVESREDKDGRSIGQIGLFLYEEFEDISFQYAFELILSIIESCLSDYLLLAKDKIETLVSMFINSLPQYIKERLRFSVCES
jgi:hypothetical protein